MKKTPNLPDTDKMQSALFANIRTLIESARSTIARDVDLVQVHTNFAIGRHIVEFPDGHFKFPHLWPVKFPQAGRLNYQFFSLPGSDLLSW